jgi:prophage antirepressor-like protein
MNSLKLFEQKQVRSIWISEEEKWYFSIVDVVAILTESSNRRRYWSDLKILLVEKEGFFELYEKIVQLKRESSDGKKYETDCASTEGILRIIQSIPSPKAEPFKRWPAKAGGKIAGNARKSLEKKSGKKVVSKENYKAISEADKKKRLKNAKKRIP